MTAAYWVLISDDLMGRDDLQWPDGFRPIEPAGYERIGMRWWLCQDDGAPEALDGTRVELTISRADGKPVITGRRPA